MELIDCIVRYLVLKCKFVVHSTLGAESAHCGPDTPKIYSVEMEDDHTYHKMKMHDNTIHHMV